MKKAGVILAATALFLVASCSRKNTTFTEINERSDSAYTGSADFSAETEKADIDLTRMSATMIYSTVFDMLIAPEDYEGKSIRIKGLFNVFTDQETGSRYYTVLVPDATACCQQGLEFIWQGDHSFPTDFPAENSEIIVTGKYVTEEEDGLTYSYLDAWSVESIL